jgi:hypothetical protein
VALVPYRDGGRVSYGLTLVNDGPLRPFTLKSGHRRYVEVDGIFANCEHYAPGSAEFIDSQPVHFEVLKQSLTETIELPTRIEWRYHASTCPRKRAS